MGQELTCDECCKNYPMGRQDSQSCKCGRYFCSSKCMLHNHICDHFYQRVATYMRYIKNYDHTDTFDPPWVHAKSAYLCFVCGGNMPTRSKHNHLIYIIDVRTYPIRRCDHCVLRGDTLCKVTFLPTYLVRILYFAIFAVSQYELPAELKNMIAETIIASL